MSNSLQPHGLQHAWPCQALLLSLKTSFCILNSKFLSWHVICKYFVPISGWQFLPFNWSVRPLWFNVIIGMIGLYPPSCLFFLSHLFLVKWLNYIYLFTIYLYMSCLFLPLFFLLSLLSFGYIVVMCVGSVTQSCPTLCNSMDCSLLASSVYGIFQARKLEWVAISFSRGSSWPRDPTCVSCIGRLILYHCATWKVTLRYSIPAGSDSKESTCSMGNLGSIPGLGRSLGGGHGNPLQYSWLGKYHGQRSLVGYITWCHKELDTTEWLSTANFLNCIFISELFIFIYLMTGISPDTGNTIVSKADKISVTP